MGINKAIIKIALNLLKYLFIKHRLAMFDQQTLHYFKLKVTTFSGQNRKNFEDFSTLTTESKGFILARQSYA